jgi:hypothetical protein
MRSWLVDSTASKWRGEQPKPAVSIVITPAVQILHVQFLLSRQAQKHLSVRRDELRQCGTPSVFVLASKAIWNSTLGYTSEASLELGEQFGWINRAGYQPLIRQLTAQRIDHGPIALDAVRPPVLSHELLSLLQVSKQPR